jgi:acetyl esterase/lipase
VPAGRIVLFGESAGATLVLSVLQTMRVEEIAFPVGVAAVSPINDLGLGSGSIDAPAGPDMLDRTVLERIVAQYLGGAPADRAPQSPLHGDLGGLPPLLVAGGDGEALLDDARRYANADTTVALDVYEGMPHAFHMSALPEPPTRIAATLLERLAAWADS